MDSENTVKNYGYFDLVCYGKDGEYIIRDIVKITKKLRKKFVFRRF